MLQAREMEDVIWRLGSYRYDNHIETNGTILGSELNCFSYVCFSPKRVNDAVRVHGFARRCLATKYDIKIVTDLQTVGVDMIKYATMLMPLTRFDRQDGEIKRRVWEYCARKGLRYSPRLQIDVWGGQKKR